MSAIMDRKNAVGYVEKPVLPICGNCVHFSSEKVLSTWMRDENLRGGKYTVEAHGVEKKMYCQAYRFAVKKTAGCKNWQSRD